MLGDTCENVDTTVRQAFVSQRRPSVTVVSTFSLSCKNYLPNDIPASQQSIYSVTNGIRGSNNFAE